MGAADADTAGITASTVAVIAIASSQASHRIRRPDITPIAVEVIAPSSCMSVPFRPRRGIRQRSSELIVHPLDPGVQPVAHVVDLLLPLRARLRGRVAPPGHEVLRG